MNYHDKKIRQALPGKYDALDSCFDLSRSHQQGIPRFSTLEIEPPTTEYRTKNLPQSHRSRLHTSDAKFSHGKCTAN